MKYAKKEEEKYDWNIAAGSRGRVLFTIIIAISADKAKSARFATIVFLLTVVEHESTLRANGFSVPT